MKRTTLALTLSMGLALGMAYSAAHAQMLDLYVKLNTAAVAGGNYILDLSLSDGDVASLGTPDTNNSVAIGPVTFNGGWPGAALPPIGNAAGDLTTGVWLADGDPGGVADFAQAFTAGNSLDINFVMTLKSDLRGISDKFLVRVLDSMGNTIGTSEPGRL